VEPKTTPVASLEARRLCQTLSGVRIRELTETAAREFLRRRSSHAPHRIRLGLGAFEDNGALVGVLVVTGYADGNSIIHVAVSPERRRLKIGTDLVQALAAGHLHTVGANLRFCRAINSDSAEALGAEVDLALF
jgi:ribosomal protein S18 acetylase RimI-like enzyme